MNRTSKIIARIIYLIALICVCIMMTGAYLFVRIGQNLKEGSGKYEMISADCEKIGNRYGDCTAPDGESYYRVSVKIKNKGQYAEKADDIFFTYTAQDGTVCMRVYEDYDNVAWDAAPVVPAGRTADVENVVSIPDGCKKVSVAFGTDTDGEGGAELSPR